jgi:hypothetical protein
MTVRRATLAVVAFLAFAPAVRAAGGLPGAFRAPAPDSDRAAWFARARTELARSPRDGRAALRRALAGRHDTSPRGVTHRLRLAALLAEAGGLDELPIITTAVADIDLSATPAESFDLLAALGRTRSERVMPLLVRALPRPPRGAAQIDLVPGGITDSDEAIEIIFAPFGADICTLLPPRLADADDKVVGVASYLLSRARCVEARPFLRKWTASDTPLVFGPALYALGIIGDAADRPLLLAASRDERPYRQGWATRALAHLGDGPSIARLIELLNVKDYWVKNNAADGLARVPTARALAALAAFRPSEVDSAVTAELLAALADEAGVSPAVLKSGDSMKLEDAADRIARRRKREREKAAAALSPPNADVAKILAVQADIFTRHDARWRSDLVPWDVALIHAGRKRADLPDAYASVEELVAVLERRCEAGAAPSCLRAAKILQSGEMRPDAQRAISLDHRGCELGLDRACYDEPGFYEVGRGVRQDTARAERMYRALCDKGKGHACTILGMYKWRGTDGKADPKASYELCFTPAPDARWAPWCAQAAQFASEGGRDAPPDLATAARLYRRACELGDDRSCDRATELAR